MAGARPQRSGSCFFGLPGSVPACLSGLADSLSPRRKKTATATACATGVTWAGSRKRLWCRRPLDLPHGLLVKYRRMARHDGRKTAQLRPVTFIRRFTRFAPGSVLVKLRPHARALHGDVAGRRSALAGGAGEGVGDRGVRHASGVHPRASPAQPAADRRARPGDSAAHRAIASGRRRS